VLADGLEQLANEAFRRPIGQADLAAGLAHAQQLGGGLVLIWREHDAESGNHHVEARVDERQRFGIGLAKLDREPLSRRPLATPFKQSGHIVRRDDLAPAARRRQRDIAVAGCDVEDLLSGAQIERLAQRLTHDLQRRANDGVVAGGPSALLAGLDCVEVGLRRGKHSCRRGCGVHLCLLWLIRGCDVALWRRGRL